MATPAPAAVLEDGHGHQLASIIRGMAVALLGSVLGGGLGFAFSIVMAHLLGQSDFGLLVLALNLLSTTALLSIAGADFAAVRFVSAAATPGGKRGAIVTAVGFVAVVNVSLALVVLAFAHPISVHLLGQPAFAGTLRALTLVLPLTVLAQMLSAGLSGLELLRGELARKVVEQGGRIVAGVAAVALGFGLVGTVLGMAVAALAAAAVVGRLLQRALPRGGRTVRLGLRPVIGFAWPQTIARTSGEVSMLTTILVLSHTTTTRTVALFGAAYAIASLPSLVYNSFAFRFMPAISRLWEAGQHDELRRLLKSVTRWVTIMSVPLFAVAIALPAPLLHVYGRGYASAGLALALLSAGGLFNSLTGPVAGGLIMTGRVKLEMWANVIGSVVVIVAALVLIPPFGLIGAAVAMLVYSVLMNSVKVLFVYRTLGTHTLSLALVGPLAAGAAASAIVAVVGSVTGLDSSLVGAVALAVLLVALYASLLLGVVGINGEDRRALRLAVRPVT